MPPRMSAGQKEALTKERRDQIIDAAMGRWLADGFEATTVDAIAREAGLAKGTVYLYFKTKQDILDEAIQRYSFLPDLEGVLAMLGRTGVPARELIPLIVRGIWMQAKARVPILAFLMRELSVRPEHGRRFIEQVVVPVGEMLTAHLQPEIDAGELREVNIFIATRALIGMVVVFIFSQEVFGGKEVYPLSDDAIVDTLADIFLHGVVPREKSN